MFILQITNIAKKCEFSISFVTFWRIFASSLRKLLEVSAAMGMFWF